MTFSNCTESNSVHIPECYFSLILILLWIFGQRVGRCDCGPGELDCLECETFVEHPKMDAVQSNRFALRCAAKPEIGIFKEFKGIF